MDRMERLDRTLKKALAKQIQTSDDVAKVLDQCGAKVRGRFYRGAFREAAMLIRALSKTHPSPLEDGIREADEMVMALDTVNGEMRLVFTQDGKTPPLAYMVVDAPKAYEMAQTILKGYDKLEGIA